MKPAEIPDSWKELPPIESPEEHRRMLARAKALMDSVPGTPEFEELVAVSKIVDDYEREHFPIGGE